MVILPVSLLTCKPHRFYRRLLFKFNKLGNVQCTLGGADIRRERFNQPIFGANNIAGRIVSEALGGAEVKVGLLCLAAAQR